MRSAECLVGTVREQPNRVVIGHVGDDAHRLRTVGAQLRDTGVESCGVDVGQHDLAPEPGEPAPRRGADAARVRGAGDHGDLAREVLHCGLSSWSPRLPPILTHMPRTSMFLDTGNLSSYVDNVTDVDPLTQAAEGAASADPAVGLRSVRALQRLQERLEAIHVANARDQGWSWQAIADALGVSRQAVHQKYNRRR